MRIVSDTYLANEMKKNLLDNTAHLTLKQSQGKNDPCVAQGEVVYQFLPRTLRILTAKSA